MLALAHYEFVFSAVAIWKPGITSTYLQRPPHLYNYACRYLIERLTWCSAGQGRKLNLFFSNRAMTSYVDLEAYMDRIQADPQCSITENTIDQFRAVNSSVKLVQIADFYASAAAAALEPNAYGLGEESYLLAVKHQLFRGAGGVFSTGFKVFPDAGRDRIRYPWLDEL